jgi:hypothetical protein
MISPAAKRACKAGVGPYIDDASGAHSHGAIFNVADAASLHRKEMGVNKEKISSFHHDLLSQTSPQTGKGRQTDQR